MCLIFQLSCSKVQKLVKNWQVESLHISAARLLNRPHAKELNFRVCNVKYARFCKSLKRVIWRDKSDSGYVHVCTEVDKGLENVLQVLIGLCKALSQYDLPQ